MVVYVDALFLVNFIINYVLLYINMKILKVKTSKARIICGGVIGAIYAVFMYYPSLNVLYCLTAKIVFSLVMAAVSYKSKSVKQLIKQTLSFYGVNFVFGGCMFAIIFLTNSGANTLIKNGVYYFNISAKTLVLSALTAFVILKTIWKAQEYKSLQSKELSDMYITFGGKTVKVTAFSDTGNSLKDPLTNNSVAVVEYNALKDLFDKSFLDTITGKNFDVSNLYTLADSRLASKLKIIPYKALGGKGLMIAFKPDEIRISKGGHLRKIDNVLIGISTQKISGSKEYNALLNPEIYV